MDDLTKTERKNLARLEGLIRDGLATFCAVGRALYEIREGRLYRDQYENFEQYCVDRWEFTRQRAYQLISAAEETARMSTIVDTPPERETHVRPLLVVPPHHRADVWREAIVTSPRDGDGRPIITARIVQQAVDRWHAGRTMDAAARPAPAADQHQTECATTGDREDGGPPAGEPHYEADPEYAGPICPECGSTETGEDEDGRFCSRCKATIDGPASPGPPDPTVAELSPDDAMLEAVDAMVRRQFAGRLAVAAARMEMLVARWRGEA